MSTQISKKIVGYSVAKPGEQAAPETRPAGEVVQMHERLERPEVLEGSTYKIRSPLFEHALYVTINDIVLNPGTSHETRRPFEVFINSKNMEHFQWAVALTRIMSAVFRKGGDVTFLVDELKAVFDPRGGYYKSGGIYMPSIVAELGQIVELHLQKIGMLETRERPPVALKAAPSDPAPASAAYPAHATLCPKCATKAMVVMDGCATCLACGHSKCN